MSIFTRFTLRSIKRNRTRTIVSIIGVALSCALITAVLTSVVSLSNALLTRTGNDEGWWYAEVVGITDDGLARLANDSDIDRWTTVSELGTVELGEENGRNYGRYLYIKTWPGEQSNEQPLLSLPEIEAGRAPENPGEILLPHFLSGVSLAPCGLATTDGGTIQLGSTVQVDLGTYTVTNSDGTSYVGTSATGYYTNDGQTASYEADLGSHTYTVVGFFRAVGYSSTYAFGNNSAYVYDDGTAVQHVVTDGSDATWASLLFNTHDPSTSVSLANHAAEDGWCTLGSTTHTSLLRWMGLTGDSQIWNALYNIAAILAVVVMVAGISLVYNSFAISVAERTRQFGLLSSLGASRRQLRHTVLVEALFIGAIGIPAGVVLGLTGCYVVFSFAGEGLNVIFSGISSGSTEATTSVPVALDPIAIGIAVALALVTLLASAWIPAIRASRVSAVDAIRQTQDVRLSRHACRAARKAARLSVGTASGDTKRPLGLSGGLFGIPGFIAHRNLTRSASKGRVTVGALAVSVALLIISGSIANVMNYASDTAVNAMEGQDLLVSVDATSAVENGTALVDQDGDIDQTGLQDALARFYADIQDIDGATSKGYTTEFAADTIIPRDMTTSDMDEFDTSDLGEKGYNASIYVDYIDEETWSSYVKGLGLSADEFCDRDHPRAIAINGYDVYSNGTYATYRPFTAGGTIRSLGYTNLDGCYVSYLELDENGQLAAVLNEYDNDGNVHESRKPLSEVVSEEAAIEVGALAETLPPCLTETSSPRVILPSWAIDSSSTMGFVDAEIIIDTNGDAVAATSAQDAISEIAEDYPELDCTYGNFAAGKQQSRMMASTVQVFIYCFTVICGLIAVANVFNTLTNSLMLRRREFAVLKSIGMGSRAFHHMIAYECASYALRGFAFGFVLAVFASYGFYLSMSLAYTTYEFSLPWVQVGISAAVVLVVILVSVAYALRCSHSASVVDALREDAI